MKTEELISLFGGLKGTQELLKGYDDLSTVELGSLGGSSFALLAANVLRRKGGLHIFVMDDRDTAGYLCNDLYRVLDREKVMFFPTAYKRSIQFGQEDPSGIVQRTATLAAIKNLAADYLAVCTWPEAMLEKVVDKDRLRRSTLKVRKGDRLSIAFVEGALVEYGFDRVDFVYEPGQYSIRGGIFDVFSYSESKPFRLDFFGDEIESIRSFELASQLSVDRLDEVEIVPNLKRGDMAGDRISFHEFAGDSAVYWVGDLDHTLKRFRDVRRKILGELEEPSEIDRMVTGARAFVEQTAANRMFLMADRAKERAADRRIEFGCTPQPSFNKNYELLAKDINDNAERGIVTYILSDNKAQIERLRNIFNSIGEKRAPFEPLELTLHAGFVCGGLKICCYTDHQIFDRYHRYALDGAIDRSESLTIAELNSLKVGDYVVHIDHGVGRFGGLVRTSENGKVQEAIKLVYRDNDVLLVNVHSLHRISKYKDKDSEPPKIYKLGSGAWQKMKTAAKKAVKDIARELIALYAKRKASSGFAFSPDSYMQYELEASFAYEDTPDQQKATEAVKRDMEAPQPMDRLVCGDVGFGKTEIAVRAAFKAASDSKQVAVLVPTTILALQHYRTFSHRLRDFPVRVEHLSRTKTAKETRQVLADLADGKIDILVGTHKILGKDVRFRDLGLLIIDEEQKFGVASKEKLRKLSVGVDTLTLTATPIPRTLQFSLMGSRDMSIIATPPPNRQPIATESHVFDEQLIKEAIEHELSRGGQVYFVNNRIENIIAIETTIRRLVPGVKTVVAHGQMPSEQLEKLLMDFIYGEFDVLVTTTIVENGVDIPNANTIIINNAHMFGLGELHQLRGRVGRSNKKAYCYLLSPPDQLLSDEARRRLRAIEEFSDLGSGFNIAMQDLDIRGAGNLLGAEQSGFIADIGFETYQKILNEAMEELRNEGVADAPAQDGGADAAERTYIGDSHIETDLEALIPDSYVSQSAEKIVLYRELDSFTCEEQLASFRDKLKDRFGELPCQVDQLLGVVRLRWYAVRAGFERVKLKNGLMIVQFVADSKSPYYKSDTFMGILKYVTSHPDRFVLKQRDDKLGLTVRKVGDVGEACRVVIGLLEEVKAGADSVRQVGEK